MKKLTLCFLLTLFLFVINGFAQDLFQKGLQQYDAKQYEPAIETFKQVVAQSPNNHAAFYNMGLCYYFLKRYNEAIPVFQQAIRVKSDYARAYVFLGNSLDAVSRTAEAATAYRKAVELEPNNASAYYGLGLTNTKQKNYPEAEKSFRKAVELNPNSVDAKIELGNTFVTLRMFPDAIVIFKEAVRLKPDAPTAYLGLGNAYYNDKKYVESVPYYQKATELIPNWKTAHLYLGDAYLNVKQYPQAVIAYNKAISLDDKLADAYYGLGLTYYNQKNNVLARQQVEKLKLIDQTKANLLAEKLKSAPTTPAPVKTAQRIKDETSVANMKDFGFDGAVVVQVSTIRETPKATGKLVLSVKRGDILSLVSRDDSNNWYQVVDENTGLEGWIDGKAVVIKLTNNKETGPPILESGRTDSIEANPIVYITNNETATTLSIRLNGTLYQIPPGTTKTVTVPAGKFTYYGWSKGIRPATGNATLQKGKKYSWSFQIYKR